MSALRVLWPDEDVGGLGLAIAPGTDDFETEILPFTAPSSSRRTDDIIGRARALFDNRCCRHCGYPVVEPIELADGFRNRKGAIIPGTATLVGFRCRGCQAEWST